MRKTSTTGDRPTARARSATAPSSAPTANGARKKLSDATSPAAKSTAMRIQIIQASMTARL